MNNQNWQLNEGDQFAPTAPDTLEHLPSHHCAADARQASNALDTLTVQALLRLTSERISTVGSKTLAMQLNGAADHIESLERQLRGLAASVIAASSVNSALERQLADASKDAARYRWLVYAGWFDDEIMRANGINEGIGDTVDAAIDAAMKDQA